MISAYSREAHNRDIDGYNRTQNALCYLVIGGIVCLALGTIFLVRAQKIRFNVRKEIERLASLRQKKQSSSDFATKCRWTLDKTLSNKRVRLYEPTQFCWRFFDF
ncbi:MAG: hypothetical protein PUC66_00695 [Erysipelotrichaceae bacterium]|nr:hypothetical protein [Erysipelotrichaceae bacterium]